MPRDDERNTPDSSTDHTSHGSALAPQGPAEGTEGPTQLDLRLLAPSPFDPRLDAGGQLVEQIAAGLRESGAFPVEHAIVARRLASGRYEIVSGHRRTRAAREAGLNEVWAFVVDWDDERAKYEAAYHNIQGEMSRWESVRHSLAIVPAQGKVGEGLDTYARRFGIGPENIRRYRRGAALVVESSCDVTGLDLDKKLDHLSELSRLLPGEVRDAALSRLLTTKWSLKDVRKFVKEQLNDDDGEVDEKPLMAGPVRMTARLTENEGERTAIVGVRNSVLSVSVAGDDVTVRALGKVEPAVLGGAEEDRPLSDARSYEVVLSIKEEFPAEIRPLLTLVEEPGLMDGMTRAVEIQIDGDIAKGTVRVVWWRTGRDYWSAQGIEHGAGAGMLTQPRIQITNEHGVFNETLDFDAARPWNTVRALKAKLQEAILRELGPTHGVHADRDEWLDRDGVPLALARVRAEADPYRGEPGTNRGDRLHGVISFPDVRAVLCRGRRPATDRERGLLLRIAPHIHHLEHEIDDVFPMPDQIGVDPFRFWFGLEAAALVRGMFRLPPAAAAHLVRESGLRVVNPVWLENGHPTLVNRPFAVLYGVERFRWIAVRNVSTSVRHTA